MYIAYCIEISNITLTFDINNNNNTTAKQLCLDK